MPKSLQGIPAHVTYLKSKDERRHKSRCIYFEPKNTCKLYGNCRGSSHCAKYSEVVTKEYKKKFGQNKKKQVGIRVGVKIKIFDKENNVSLTLELVDKGQADPFNNKISVDSPLGEAVLGKKKGDRIEVFTDKKRQYRITNDNVK